MIGYMPTTDEYQSLMLSYQTDPISSLREILTVLGTFKSFTDARERVMDRVSISSLLKKIYTPGILGLVRFLQGFYLMYVTGSEIVGEIGGNSNNN